MFVYVNELKHVWAQSYRSWGSHCCSCRYLLELKPIQYMTLYIERKQQHSFHRKAVSLSYCILHIQYLCPLPAHLQLLMQWHSLIWDFPFLFFFFFQSTTLLSAKRFSKRAGKISFIIFYPSGFQINLLTTANLSIINQSAAFHSFHIQCSICFTSEWTFTLSYL